MKKILGILLALMIWIPNIAMASNHVLSVDGLSEQQRAEMALKIAKMKSVPESVTVDQMERYAAIGIQYGKAIGAAAKELGIAVNDFMDTPAGVLAAVLIVWHIAGETLLGVVGGALWFTTMIPLWVWFFHKLVLRNRAGEITYNEKGKIESKVFDPILWHKSSTGGMAFVMAVILVFICGAGFIMIF